MTEPAEIQDQTTTTTRLLSAIRVEDGVLAGWSLVAPAIGASLRFVPGDTSHPNPLIGVVELLAILGAFVALLTRPGEQPPVRVADQEAPRWIIAGPLIGGLAFASSTAFDNLGLQSGDVVIGLAFVTIMVATLGANHLPVVAAPIRRALVLPFILVCASLFNGFAALFLEGLNIDAIVGSSPAGDVGFVLFVLTLILGGMAAFYAMFVVAPRELADPEDSGPRWVIRFALYVAASLLGIGWLAVIGP